MMKHCKYKHVPFSSTSSVSCLDCIGETSAVQPLHIKIFTVYQKCVANTQTPPLIEAWFFFFMSVTLFLCDVVQGGQRARAPQQPGASWEFFIHDDLIHRLELPLSTKVQSTIDQPHSYYYLDRGEKRKKSPQCRTIPFTVLKEKKNK